MRRWLLLDGSQPESLSVSVVSEQGDRLVERRMAIGGRRRSSILPFIVGAAEGAEASVDKLAGIAVVNAVGSFTTLRLTVAIANTLSWLLHLPVVSLPPRMGGTEGKRHRAVFVQALFRGRPLAFIQPTYIGKPNITRP